MWFGRGLILLPMSALRSANQVVYVELRLHCSLLVTLQHFEHFLGAESGGSGAKVAMHFMRVRAWVS